MFGDLLENIFMTPASEDSESIRQLFGYFLWTAAVVMAVVTGLVVYYSIKYKAKPGQGEPEQRHTHKGLEVSILAGVTVVMGLFFYLTIDTMLSVQAAPAPGQQPDLVITGHQWWWEGSYPKSGVVVANEIHIPTGKRLLLELRSGDVIHDWWVPELGRKMDAIPGKPNQLWMEARRPGTYLGACSEFCGAQHAWMRIQVIAQSPQDFAAWEKAQLKTPAAIYQTELIKNGEVLFQQKTCANCHTIAATEAQANIGPNLSHLASRKTLLTGILKNNPENLAKWLDNPQAVKPGAHMPNFRFNKKELASLVAYLNSLK